MKKILLLAAGSAALAATPAFAAPAADESFTVTASVEKECSLDDISDVNLGSIPINTNSGPNALLINGDTPRSSDQVWLSCNSANRLRIESQNGGLLSPSNAGASAPFTNLINYRIAVIGYGGSPVLQTTGTPGEFTLTDPKPAIHAQVNVRVDVRDDENPNTRPLAGNDYSDVATITVTAI